MKIVLVRFWEIIFGFYGKAFIRRLFCAFSLFILFSIPYPLVFADNIPNPIEENISLEPQEANSSTANIEEFVDTTVFDLYLNDVPIGNILANYTDHWFEIDAPEDVVEQLKNKLKGGELKIQELCSGKIEGKREIHEVGKVMFDPYTFRIIVVVDPRYLRVSGISTSNLLPDPERTFTLLQGVQAASSGSASSVFSSSSLSHKTRFSLGKSYLKAEGTFSHTSSGFLGASSNAQANADDDTFYSLSDLSAGTFWGPVRQELGYLKTGASRLIGSMEYLGSRAENTDQLLVDQDLIKGSPLRIFIPSRSRVEFFQGSRLLDSQILNAGLQEIDTSNFPQGSYDIDVRIHESSGNVVQERHFFAKSGLLTVKARPIVTLEGGKLRSGSDLEDGYVYHAGIRWRALDFLQLEPAIFGSENITLGSLDIVGILGESTYVLSGAYGSDGSSGLSGSFYGRLPLDLSWNAGFQLSSSNKESQTDTSVRKSGYSKNLAINPGLRSVYGRIDRRFGNLWLYFQANKSGKKEVEVNNDFGPPDPDKELKQPTLVYGPGFSYPLWSGRAGAVSIGGSYLWSDADDGYQAFINYTKDLGPRWYANVSAEGNTVGSTDTYRAGTLLNYYDSSGRGVTGTKAQWREDLRHTSGPITGDKDSIISSLDLNYANSLFRSRGYIYDQRQNESSSTNLGIQADSSLLYSGGEISVTQGAGVESAVVVELKSASIKESKFDVLINGSNYDTVPVGRSALIPLSPFRTYKVNLRQSRESKELISLDAETYDITLFPGNVIKKIWTAEKIFIALGRLVNEQGEGIRYQRLYGLHEYTITEEDGSFQAEVSGLEKPSIKSDLYECDIKLPKEHRPDEMIVDLGDIVCASKKSSSQDPLISFRKALNNALG